jgi:hypothetical protein
MRIISHNCISIHVQTLLVMINQAVIFQSSLITHSKREPDSALEIEH